MVIASPQINLHLTDGIFENTGDIALQHDCLHVAASTEGANRREIISYCMSELPSKWNIEKNSLGTMFTFGELSYKNITSEQLYRWSSPMDIIERYQLYLNKLSIGNVSSTMETQLYYNCTSPNFGPLCQYSLDISEPSSSYSLNEIVADYYSYQIYKLEILTCYTHLQCNRGPFSICLDWSEICDGKVDCADGIDEKNCFPLLHNKCEDGEYRCDNGQCISKRFVNDDFNSSECLDRSDEYHILSMPPRYEYDQPTFENEDAICSWRGRSLNNYLNIRPLTSSCVRQRERHLRIEQAMFSAVSNVMHETCLSAFKCHSNIPTYDYPLCSDLCQNEMCIKTINETCPDMFYYPAVPIAFGHIYFAYTKQYTLQWKDIDQMPPEYICYTEQLCGGFYSNTTLRLFGNSTCRRPQDFPVSFQNSNAQWYFDYVEPLYSQLSHCNKMVDDSSIVCNSSIMYRCKNSSKCIPKSYVGDGIRDCDYKDDEEQTTIDEICLTDKTDTFFKCQSENKCIHRNRVEDGVCNCKKNEYGMCDDENLQLNEIRRKIKFSTICDRFVDLLPFTINGQDQTDETNCEQWLCNNTHTRCNGVWNCPNGADEIGCNPSPLIQCPSFHHICVSPITYQLMCLPIQKANDGNIDCLGGMDEPNLCLVMNHFNEEKYFYCKGSESCISPWYLCDEIFNCENGDDENFCNDALSIENINQNFFTRHSNNGFQSKIARTLSKKPKANVMISRSSSIDQPLQHCQRGLPLRVWLDNKNGLSTTTCLCPPSYYGDHCQYQNQRVSLTMQFSAPSKSQQTPFVLVISLIDDSFQRIIHSYQQLTYLPIRDQHTKFNIYLLYSNRPKDLTKQYAVHIDIYEMISLNYRGSLLIPLKFPVLPVERLAINFEMPQLTDNIQTCTNLQCGHGECIQYLNDPYRISFCKCKNGWSGRYCTIPQMNSCSSDSLCAGVATNNRSICVCPLNKFGSQCLLTQTVCQHTPCQNGGLCLPSNEHSASSDLYTCICRTGFSGKRCEVPDTKIILMFDSKIRLPSRSLVYFHFIHVSDEAVPNNNKTWQIICGSETSVIGHWSHPFHIAFFELSAFQYYLIIHQKIYSQSSTIVRTINPSDRCRSVNEIFNKTIAQMPLIQRIKYYHVPCQNRSSNLSCFYDDVYMCLCADNGGQRSANCVEFNHSAKLDDLNSEKQNIELACPPDHSSNSSTLSSVRSLESFLYLFTLLLWFL